MIQAATARSTQGHTNLVAPPATRGAVLFGCRYPDAFLRGQGALNFDAPLRNERGEGVVGMPAYRALEIADKTVEHTADQGRVREEVRDASSRFGLYSIVQQAVTDRLTGRG
ncbi:hypothetical protein BB934_38125 (plasmid) [Microvirga ossetica]|uniref:Uncharacterized protein n=1 Tax=Microvirga ossetica TaxID=1882682 RepID=A0A1B2EVU5_9HYPH|nr:hypothetical protein BB934_38125 [Microvirga ossetica]